MKSTAIIDAVQGVTKKWAKPRKSEERETSARRNRAIVMMRRRHISIRDAAWQVMEEAYLKASANGTLPANARQVMYAARPYIQRHADRDLGSRFDQYFTQQLLPDFIEENRVDWDVVYDDRGHFREPHSKEVVGLGTLNVRKYLGDVSLSEDSEDEDEELDFQLPEEAFSIRGPEHRFGAILFIEKEGFMPLFEAVHLAERFDIAIMSTKGVSVTAARSLVDELCGEHDIPLLVLHDFDKSGFTILGTLQRDTRRYTFINNIEVIDLGLRLDDIEGLETETVYRRGERAAIEDNLSENGATGAEIQFLLDRRVELNAMTSPALVAFIERKLTAAGITKVIPDQPILEQACRRIQMHERMSKRLEDVRKQIEDEVKTLPVPKDLLGRVRAVLAKRPKLPWEEAVRHVVSTREAAQ
jgi:Topoisomerase 6 subunit A/Spo11, Toprim domain